MFHVQPNEKGGVQVERRVAVAAPCVSQTKEQRCEKLFLWQAVAATGVVAGCGSSSSCSTTNDPETVIFLLTAHDRWHAPPPLLGSDEAGLIVQMRSLQADVDRGLAKFSSTCPATPH